MSIRLELYRIFNTVAECQSFSQAARELFLSQPAVSQAVMQLEEELGTRLFTRTPRGVILTSQGKLLLEFTNPALALLDTGEKKLKGARSLRDAELKVGVSDTVCRYYLLPYLKRFYKEHPNIRLKIINKTTEVLCDLIKAGEIDLGVCNLPLEDHALEIRECKNIQDIFVGSSKYKEVLAKPLPYKELVEYPLILLDTWSRTRQYVEKYFLAQGVKLEPEIELGSHDLLLEFAKMGLGIACVVREFSEDYLTAGLLFEIPLEQKIPPRAIGICSLKGISWSPASEKFVQSLLEQ